MDPSPRPQNDHHIGRRVRELYRYFQPEPSPQPTLVSSYFDSWAAGESSASDNATVPAVSTASMSTPDPAAGLCTGPSPGEGLVLGNPNRTLSSFAQLAAMRLGVQRVLIRYGRSSVPSAWFVLMQAVSRTATRNTPWPTLHNQMAGPAYQHLTIPGASAR